MEKASPDSVRPMMDPSEQRNKGKTSACQEFFGSVASANRRRGDESKVAKPNWLGHSVRDKVRSHRLMRASSILSPLSPSLRSLSSRLKSDRRSNSFVRGRSEDKRRQDLDRANSMNKERKRSQRRQQHPKDFPGGLPPQYYPGLAPLDFRVQMGSGTFDAVWPLATGDFLRRLLPATVLAPPLGMFLYPTILGLAALCSLSSSIFYLAHISS